MLDSLAVHRSPTAAEILRAEGAWFLFLPPYSPDLNPIELAFAKLKAHLRRIGARTLDALWHAVGEICGLFVRRFCSYFTGNRTRFTYSDCRRLTPQFQSLAAAGFADA